MVYYEAGVFGTVLGRLDDCHAPLLVLRAFCQLAAQLFVFASQRGYALLKLQKLGFPGLPLFSFVEAAEQLDHILRAFERLLPFLAHDLVLEHAVPAF